MAGASPPKRRLLSCSFMFVLRRLYFRQLLLPPDRRLLHEEQMARHPRPGHSLHGPTTCACRNNQERMEGNAGLRCVLKSDAIRCKSGRLLTVEKKGTINTLVEYHEFSSDRQFIIISLYLAGHNTVWIKNDPKPALTAATGFL